MPDDDKVLTRGEARSIRAEQYRLERRIRELETQLAEARIRDLETRLRILAEALARLAVGVGAGRRREIEDMLTRYGPDDPVRAWEG